MGLEEPPGVRLHEGIEVGRVREMHGIAGVPAAPADAIEDAQDNGGDAHGDSSGAGLGGAGDLLSACVAQIERDHPDLWRGSVEQTALIEQMRDTRRLCHLFRHLQRDFAAGP